MCICLLLRHICYKLGSKLNMKNYHFAQQMMETGNRTRLKRMETGNRTRFKEWKLGIGLDSKEWKLGMGLD